MFIVKLYEHKARKDKLLLEIGGDNEDIMIFVSYK